MLKNIIDFLKNIFVYQPTVILIKFFSLFIADIKIIGRKNIPQETPFIVSANHQKWFDIPLLTIITWKFHSTYIAKKEYWQKNIPLTFWLECVKAIPVDREKPTRDTIRKTIKALNNKEMLLIFPEGTRNKTDKKMLELKSGIRLFAYSYKNDLPILPICLAYSKQKNIFGFPKNIIIYIKKPFMKSLVNKKEFMETLKNKMSLALEKAEEELQKTNPQK